MGRGFRGPRLGVDAYRHSQHRLQTAGWTEREGQYTALGVVKGGDNALQQIFWTLTGAIEEVYGMVVVMTG
jgi:hypothetical protein